MLIAQGWLVASAQEASPPSSPIASPVAGAAAQFIARFDAAAGELPEGVAVAADGTVYTTFSPLGQLVRLGPGEGEHEVVATIEGLEEGDIGMLGLAVHTDGSVYAGVFSANPEAHGVWRMDVAGGDVARVPGTEQIGLPNAMVFDAAGTMYVTDTIAGAVWSVAPNGTAEQWLHHELLVGNERLGFGFPVGANGIALNETGDTLYVAVLEQASIVTIPVAADGTAGEPGVFVDLSDDPAPMLPDGITFDAAGNLYVALPTVNTVVRVTPDGGMETVATAGDGMDGPASVAIDDEAGRLYVANFSIALVPPGGAGPGIVMIELDV
jgi:sugar lactone lactonase YvrE